MRERFEVREDRLDVVDATGRVEDALADGAEAICHHPWRMNEAEQADYGVELGVGYPEPVTDPDARYDEMR